jgi:hypothetical protein
MKATFIGEEVAVRIDRPPGPVSAFTWRGVKYVVAEVESGRTRIDRQRAWWRRRHRDECTVRTTTGETFVLHAYHEARKRRWVLYEKIEAQAEG